MNTNRHTNIHINAFYYDDETQTIDGEEEKKSAIQQPFGKMSYIRIPHSVARKKNRSQNILELRAEMRVDM